MKCQSVGCVWSGAPPLHRVVATAVLSHPPTLYTGGSDGSIIWWAPASEHTQVFSPLAMLCGHASAIADLDICLPITIDVYGEMGGSTRSSSGNVEISSSSSSAAADYGALISACTDGVLCVWSRKGGHCRRRRKMPPWAGRPSSISTLPTSPRHVCIACSSIDNTAHALNHQDLYPSESGDTSEGLIDRKASQCTVVIVDSYTLNILRTVFHGSLSIGTLKFMALVPSAVDAETSTLFVSDALGGVQSISIAKESDQDGKGGTISNRSSHPVISVWNVVLGDGSGNLVSMVSHGKLLVLVYRTTCVFRLVGNGAIIGEMSFLDNPIWENDFAAQSHLAGGMFLNIEDNEDCEEEFVENFAVWSNKGAMIGYRITGSEDTFKFEPLFGIPSISYSSDTKISVNFCQLNCNLLRVESFGVVFEESLIWRSQITIWSPCEQTSTTLKNLSKQCKMLGKGASLEPTTCENEVTFPQFYNGSFGNNGREGIDSKGQTVSSSMVLSDSFSLPYAIVYGFYNGEIEVVRFEMFFPEVIFVDGSPRHNVRKHITKQCFSGHTGPILCMAAHHMIGNSNEQSYRRVLVSGSMDCTIRIWDLDMGNHITVMHHHVAPVRQIILPPPRTDRPWNDCFLSVGEDSCVALVSLETLRVERMFPGHPSFPSFVVWDSVRGYVACLCKNTTGISDSVDVLCLWDVKTGARERVLRGTASHSMFDHFCRGININPATGSVLGGITSTSSLLLPIIEDTNFTESLVKNIEKGVTSVQNRTPESAQSTISLTHASKGKSTKTPPLQIFEKVGHPIKCSTPFPGITAMLFDLSSLMSPCQNYGVERNDKQVNPQIPDLEPDTPNSHHAPSSTWASARGINDSMEDQEWFKSLEGYIIRFTLSFLHWWGVDHELDNLLISEMNVKRPENFIVASGLLGDRGSFTLTFPGSHATHELWRSSSEFCAIRSLTMVSLAQRMISLSLSSSAACSALSAFYTRSFAEKVHDIKPPSLQLLVSFWQDESEHVRMAARSLFHCAASRAIPYPLSCHKENHHTLLPLLEDGVDKHKNDDNDGTNVSNLLKSQKITEQNGISQADESGIHAWLESFEMQDWVSCVGGTRQDAMASHISVAAALAVWYPSLVKPCLATSVVHTLIKLVMAMNEKYSSTAAELLAEGMESTWKACIGSEIPRLIGDVFFQIDCLSSASAKSSVQNRSVAATFRETLVGTLLPSLAVADIPGFLQVIESEIWSTASDSPVHSISLMTLIRVVRASPKPLAQYIDKVVGFILQTMDLGNLVMRKACLRSSMAALKEVVRVYPMVALNDSSTRLAVADAIGDINSVTIKVYDMQSVVMIKVLDASGPPGLPNLLGGTPEARLTTAISALSFSPDSEGLVAFSEHGLMIRWWSLGSAWWEKLSRSHVPVQCTKLIFVPPWEGFSPNSSRSSIFASINAHDKEVNTEEKERGSCELENLKLLIYNLDLSYRLEWVGDRKVLLKRHGLELGTFQL